MRRVSMRPFAPCCINANTVRGLWSPLVDSTAMSGLSFSSRSYRGENTCSKIAFTFKLMLIALGAACSSHPPSMRCHMITRCRKCISTCSSFVIHPSHLMVTLDSRVYVMAYMMVIKIYVCIFNLRVDFRVVTQRFSWPSLHIHFML